LGRVRPRWSTCGKAAPGYTTSTKDRPPEKPRIQRAASSWAFRIAPERSLLHAYIGKFRPRDSGELQAGLGLYGIFGRDSTRKCAP
jgi:hypothetical protein